MIAHCVPTRAFRVIAMPGDKVFRVEQLQPQVWKWAVLSTHAGDTEFESFGVALQDAIDKQETFKRKIIQAQNRQRQAERQAEKDHGKFTAV